MFDRFLLLRANDIAQADGEEGSEYRIVFHIVHGEAAWVTPTWRKPQVSS